MPVEWWIPLETGIFPPRGRWKSRDGIKKEFSQQQRHRVKITRVYKKDRVVSTMST
jgi:hypothetical protein